MLKRIFLKGSRLDRFEALQNELVPLSKSLSDQEREHSRKLVNLVLEDKPAVIHFKIALFLWLIDTMSFFYGGHRFKNLKADTKAKLLRLLFASKLGLLRKGFWGLCTLAKIGVYGQESLYPKLNYRLKETPHD